MNFKEEVDVFGYKLKSYDQCKSSPRNSSLNHGGFFFGTGYGQTCNAEPAIPALYTSQCQESDVDNEICGREKTFCDSFLISSTCADASKGCDLEDMTWESW